MLIIGGGFINLRLVQIGIPGFGLTVLNLSEETVIIALFLLGITACVSCICIGFVLEKHPIMFNEKKICFIVLTWLNTLLIYITYFITDQLGYLLWVIIIGVYFGALSGIAYSLIFYLIPRNRRGGVAAILGGVMYFISASYPGDWSFEMFRDQSILIWPLIFGILGFFILFDVFDNGKIEINQNLEPNFQINAKPIIIILILILFLDSFGFLRIIETQEISSQMWLSNQSFKIYIGIIHLVSAIIIGVFYKKIGPFNTLILSLFLFVIADFVIALIPFSETIRIIFPLLYASAVSVYTLILMSIFADISTKETINRNTSIGFGLIGWFSAYTGTGLCYYFIYLNIPFSFHLIISGGIALTSIFIVLHFKYKSKRTE